jgi:hypothetical protein
LELRQGIEGKPHVSDTVALPNFQPNAPSSVALLDRSPDDVTVRV